MPTEADAWARFWDGDHDIFVSPRHLEAHHRMMAKDVVALLPGPDARVLDYGCGEALHADEIAAHCRSLILCEAGPRVRERLAQRFGAIPNIEIVTSQDVERIADGSIDLVVVNSVIQYLKPEELDGLLQLLRPKLSPRGAIALGDVIGDKENAVTDVLALLRLAWREGFLLAAFRGLFRTYFSEYRTLRNEVGLTRYADADLLARLRKNGFSGRRHHKNLGSGQSRTTFVATPV